ncbi:unnamed protein product [Trichogramma brassicae]|uniref:Uncharacterized protein n=1 Tax=Trichogramma brassicae TaxID=86971 RepID=A0A6H5IPB9_9HYME|nr:unnamed protein product [Trichogramma brassicae]
MKIQPKKRTLKFHFWCETIASPIRCAHVYTCIYRSFLFWLSRARPFAKLLLIRNFSFRVRVVCRLLGLIESNSSSSNSSSSSSSMRAPTHTHAAATSPTNPRHRSEKLFSVRARFVGERRAARTRQALCIFRGATLCCQLAEVRSACQIDPRSRYPSSKPYRSLFFAFACDTRSSYTAAAALAAAARGCYYSGGAAAAAAAAAAAVHAQPIYTESPSVIIIHQRVFNCLPMSENIIENKPV